MAASCSPALGLRSPASGCCWVVAIEQNRRIAAVARTNLEAVHQRLGDDGRQASAWAVHCSEVVRWLAEPNQQAAFDLIYADPPTPQTFMPS